MEPGDRAAHGEDGAAVKVIIAGSRDLIVKETGEWIASAFGALLAWAVWLGLFAVWAICNAMTAQR